MEIVDKVQIPADLKPGSYVLGWRYVIMFLSLPPCGRCAQHCFCAGGTVKRATRSGNRARTSLLLSNWIATGVLGESVR